MSKAELSVTGAYRVCIAPDQTIEKLLETGHYEFISPYMRELQFPRADYRVSRDEVHEIELVYFGHDISTDDALKELDKRGLRPANAVELLAFGASFPDVQREFPVVALGQVFPYPHGSRNVVALGSLGEPRCVFVWPAHDWYDRCRFAAIRK